MGSAFQMQALSTVAAEEFLEVYKGVLPEYHDIVEQMCAGPVVAMEIRQENAVETFRKLVGPHDPEIARHLRPDTLRGQFGVDRVQNTLHCSDLRTGFWSVSTFSRCCSSKRSGFAELRFDAAAVNAADSRNCGCLLLVFSTAVQRRPG